MFYKCFRAYLSDFGGNFRTEIGLFRPKIARICFTMVLENHFRDLHKNRFLFNEGACPVCSGKDLCPITVYGQDSPITLEAGKKGSFFLGVLTSVRRSTWRDLRDSYLLCIKSYKKVHFANHFLTNEIFGIFIIILITKVSY